MSNSEEYSERGWALNKLNIKRAFHIDYFGYYRALTDSTFSAAALNSFE